MMKSIIGNILSMQVYRMTIYSSLMDQILQIKLWMNSLKLLRIILANLIVELLLFIAKLVWEEQERSSVFGPWSISKFQLNLLLDGSELPDQDQSSGHNNFTFLKWSQTIYYHIFLLKKVD